MSSTKTLTLLLILSTTYLLVTRVNGSNDTTPSTGNTNVTIVTTAVPTLSDNSTTTQHAINTTTASTANATNSTTASPTTINTNVTTASPTATNTTTPSNSNATNVTTASPSTMNTTTPSQSNNTNVTTASPSTMNTTTPSQSNNTNVTTASPSTMNTTTASIVNSTLNTTSAPSTPSNAPANTVSANTTTGGTTTKNTTTPLTSQSLSVVYMRLHITNQAYSTSLNDATSAYYKTLEASIIKLYNDAFNCSSCSTRNTYLGVIILAFSSGSVIADTQVRFSDSQTPSSAQTTITNYLSKNNNQIDGLQISDVQASPSQFQTSSPAVVPGWGIALLVLVSVLLLFCIIFIIVMIVLYCRRQHRGYMDVFASRGSYHSMNDYTPYQTHGRYVAPNKYEASSGNGTKNKFSYTNQGLETNDL